MRALKEQLVGRGQESRQIIHSPVAVAAASISHVRPWNHHVKRRAGLHQKGELASPLNLPGTRLLGAANFLATLRGAAFGRLTPSAFSNNSCSSFFSAAVTVLVKFCGRSTTNRCTLAIHSRDSAEGCSPISPSDGGPRGILAAQSKRKH